MASLSLRATAGRGGCGAAALADSPAGQAAWIYEKFQSKSDIHGLAEDAISTDDMLDAISLYWFTNSAASSARIYWENRSATWNSPGSWSARSAPACAPFVPDAVALAQARANGPR